MILVLAVAEKNINIVTEKMLNFNVTPCMENFAGYFMVSPEKIGCKYR